MKELYYFAYSTRKDVAPKIREWLKEQGKRVFAVKALLLRGKSNVKRGLKRIYHAIR